jgi:hypothetical protein
LRTPPGPADAEPDAAPDETAAAAAGLADRPWPGAAALDAEVAVHPATTASKPSQPSTRRLTMIVRMLASRFPS